MSALKGLTWKHDRGVAPLLATAHEFEQREGVRIDWEARSLHEFGDVSVAGVADQFDMIVIDHPFMGDVARDGFLLPLDELVDAPLLAKLSQESVGASHQSYLYGGHQWALAIDAASQVSGYRPDLLETVGHPVPQTWDAVLDLAKVRPGLVTPALLPLDSMMCFFSLCANAGFPAMQGADQVVDPEAGEFALSRLLALAEHAIEGAFQMNPIAVWERMSATDEIVYCPLAFGYSNYARNGYRRSRVTYTNIPAGGQGCSGATLGGAGLAITRRCANIPAAARYAGWIASADCQSGIYVESGGQPGNRHAWLDSKTNALTNGYFESILPTLECAYVRPRFAGFVDFQTAGARIVWGFLTEKSSARNAMRALNELYRTWPK